MSLATKLQNWTEQSFLSKQQADLIKTYEKSKPSQLCFILLGICASLLIIMGILTIITQFSYTTQIVIMSLLLVADILAVFMGIKIKKPILREAGVVISLFLIASIIYQVLLLLLERGSIGYPFDRSMPGLAFVLASLPFILCSRSLILTILWVLFVLMPVIPTDTLEELRKWSIQHVYGFMLMSSGLALLSYGLKYAYKILAAYHIVLLNALAFWLRVAAYVALFGGGTIWGLVNCPMVISLLIGRFAQPAPLTASLFVFAFLFWQMGYAFLTFKANSFARNAALLAVWIFILSLSSVRIPTPGVVGTYIIVLGLAIFGSIFLTKRLFAYLASMRAAQKSATAELNLPAEEE